MDAVNRFMKKISVLFKNFDESRKIVANFTNYSP